MKVNLMKFDGLLLKWYMYQGSEEPKFSEISLNSFLLCTYLRGCP